MINLPIKRILLQQQSNDLLCLRLDLPVLRVRPLDVVVDRVAKQLFRRLAKERDTADEELVEYDAHTPPVHWLAVALSQYHLRRDVLRCAEYLNTSLHYLTWTSCQPNSVQGEMKVFFLLLKIFTA